MVQHFAWVLFGAVTVVRSIGSVAAPLHYSPIAAGHNAHGTLRARSSCLVVVEQLEHLFHLGELLFRLGDGCLKLIEALLLGDIVGTRLVLLVAVMLDLLARGLHFG